MTPILANVGTTKIFTASAPSSIKAATDADAEDDDEGKTQPALEILLKRAAG